MSSSSIALVVVLACGLFPIRTSAESPGDRATKLTVFDPKAEGYASCRIPGLAGFVHQTMEALLPDLDGEYCLQLGKSVVELKPAGKDKGRALREFMAEPPFGGRTPVFVGDDASDELGFATVNQLGGHSIKVGAGDTVARWRLDNVHAVEQWLRSISH